MNCSLIECKNGAKCFMDDIEAICDCIPCFTGPRCEQNLTTLVPMYAVWSNNLPKKINWYFIVLQCFTIIMLLDNLLCIQTILSSQKIRITNLGIYLSVFSLARIVVGILLQIMILYNLNKSKQSKNYILFSLVFSFFYVSIWCSSCISIERMLIQLKYFNIQLYDKRWRSVITLFVLISFVFLTQFAIPGLIYLRREQQFNDALEILIRTFTMIHHIIPFFLHLIPSIVVLLNLVKHKREVGVLHSWCSLICQQVTKHRDFFLQPTVYICFTLPFMIFFLRGIYIDDDCTQMGHIFAQKHILIYTLGIFFVPILFTFPVLIWPNEIYMIEFHDSSILGLCYQKLKSKCHVYCCQKK